jgi:hypothetical protein
MVEIAAPRSRRAVLAATAGAAAATVIAAIDRPSVVLAGSDGDVVLGAFNKTNTTTSIEYSGGADGTGGLRGYAASLSGDVRGVWGETPSTGGMGVIGYATASTGTTTGVWGRADSTGGLGVVGYAAASTGKTKGVFGRAESPDGIGVLAIAPTGTALSVAGRAQFTRSGEATILAGKKYADITVAGGLTSRSVVHATLQTYRAGVAIAAVRRNYPSTGKARIHLTKVASSTSSTYVGWFVAEY